MTATAHQFLHGYADGHRLLAGSSEFSSAIMRDLLVHSDASPGPSGQRALSSLPLADAGMWALTATWRADEMPRPGSVWSHTLVLDSAALRALQGGGGLLSALRRPRGPTDFAAYRQPLKLSDERVRPAGPSTQRLLQAVLLALYAWPDQAAAVLSQRLEDGERALIAAWEQQWPELRETASFSVRGRVTSDTPAAVQVASARGRGRPGLPVVDSDQPLPEPAPAWIDDLLVDIERPGSLREFLVRFGPDAVGGRGDMHLLVELHQGLRSPTRPRELFSRLAESYPHPDEMAPLKHEALGSAKTLWVVPESQRILIAIEFHENVRWTRLDLGSRLASLWPSDDKAVIDTLRRAWDSSTDPRLADELIAELATRADGLMLRHLAEAEVSLAVHLASRRPDLLNDPSLWEVPGDWQEPLAVKLSDEGVLPVELASILIEVGNVELAARLLRVGVLDGKDLARAIATRGFSRETLRIYRSVFADSKGDALGSAALDGAGWVERALAALLGGTRNCIVKEHGDELARHLDQLDERSQVELATRLLLAEPDGPASKQVMQATFPVLHRALVNERLPQKNWKQLDKVLPSANRQDRNERLGKALLESIHTGGWTEHEIAQVLENAGPKAKKLRELTEKKSDMRKLFDDAWDLITSR